MTDWNPPTGEASHVIECGNPNCDLHDDQRLEDRRRALLPEMPAECLAAIERGEPVWDIDAMQKEFEAIGFAAPLIVVRRRSDGVKGSLMFTHNPRFYFGFQAHDD